MLVSLTDNRWSRSVRPN